MKSTTAQLQKNANCPYFFKGQSKNAHISANGKWIALLSDSDELHEEHDISAWRAYIIRIHDDNGDLSFEIVRVIDAGEVSDYEPDNLTQPVVSGNGRFIALDMKHTGTEPRQVFVHENARLLGDLNGDGVVDETDEDILLFNWGTCPCCAADLDGNGTVGVSDLLILFENWGDNTCNWVVNGGD